MLKATRLFPIVALLLVTTIALGTATAARAQTDTTAITDDQVNEVARDLYCPVCESTPLDVCPTAACRDWREVIRVQLAEGRTKQEIMDYFANQYGGRVLAEPPRSGFALIVWLLPAAAVIGGGFLFARYLNGLRRAENERVGETAPPPPSPQEDDDYMARVEKELQEKS
ncbi:MAG: cytochrome c-type biogenesis protein CcmH [Candidatus Promineifilaceae bacterium]